ncbi:MAG TPA: CDP-alcohol phosphatidyltransferase family protein [Candidatus Methanoperedens sp.]|nr:CDP-alcohol phosphatidyltransferase family protein [Candidatus Methanoperedens sp.]
MNVPNVITTLRLLLLPAFLTLLVYRLPGAALAVLLAAALSDALDGLIARRLNQRTAIGSFLDPLADKLLSVSGFVTLTFLGPIPAWFVITVISRDVIISLGSLVLYLHEGRLEIAPSLAGKAATLCQFLTLALTLVVQITGAGAAAWRWLLLATAALTVISGLQYLWRGLAIAGTKPAADA